MKHKHQKRRKKVLMMASVASMVDQFNMPNIRLLQDLGYEVHVACNFMEGNTCDRRQIARLCKTLQDIGVVSHQWDCPRSVWAAGKCCRAYGQLIRLLQSRHFVWMHCQSPIGGVLARIAAHKEGIPVVYTAHGFHFYQGAPMINWLLYYPVEKLLSYWTDVLITVNQEDYLFAKKNLKVEKIFRIHGIGIDTERFQKTSGQGIRSKYHIPKDAQLLLSVGELSKRKNHQLVIAALEELQEKNVYYLICGQGQMKKALMRQAGKLGMEHRIRIAGFQKDVADVYQNADIFVFPSVQEGMPAALMEAMAAGLPCVVSDIRGNRELVDSRGGIRFSLIQKGQLLEGITQLLEDEQLRQACGCYNRKKIRRYDTKGVLVQMKKIYKQMGRKQIKILHVLKSGRFSGAEHVALTICRNCGSPFESAYASENGEICKWLEKDQIAYYPMKKLNLRELGRVLREYQPDIVHAHDFTASVLCAAVRHRYVLISHLHNDPHWIRRWNIRSLSYQAAKKHFDHILLVSDVIRQEAVFLKNDENKITVTGNPVDVIRVKRLSEEPGADAVQAGRLQRKTTEDAADLLFVGRLTRQKAPERFIKIVYRLRRNGMPIRAVMLGDGELFVKCRAWITKLGLDEFICMKGFLPNPYPYMKQAKLLVIPSDWEGYGLAAAEALTLGTPVLASPVGGLQERFRYFPQALCSGEKEFARKAARLLKDDKLYEKFCQEMMQKVRIEELETYMHKIKNIYEEVQI